MPSLTQRTVETAPVKQARYTIWDDKVPGFGLLVLPTGVKSFVFQYRNQTGRSRRGTLGKFGALTPKQARDLAKDWAYQVRLEKDPLEERSTNRASKTVAELCEIYWQSVQRDKKPTTLKTDRGRIDRHIKPLIGALKVKAVTKEDVEKFYGDVCDGKTAVIERTGPHGVARVTGGTGTASRTLGLLGAIFKYGVDHSYMAFNPARGVSRQPDRKMERFLSTGEFARLGEALREFEEADGNPIATNLIRFLAVTGLRKSEASDLKWEYLDWERQLVNLPDSKTGARPVQLSAAAM